MSFLFFLFRKIGGSSTVSQCFILDHIQYGVTQSKRYITLTLTGSNSPTISQLMQTDGHMDMKHMIYIKLLSSVPYLTLLFISPPFYSFSHSPLSSFQSLKFIPLSLTLFFIVPLLKLFYSSPPPLNHLFITPLLTPCNSYPPPFLTLLFIPSFFDTFIHSSSFRSLFSLLALPHSQHPFLKGTQD